LPTEYVEADSCTLATVTGGAAAGVTCFSGVRALKTACCTNLPSGVFGLDEDVGPDTTRFRVGRATEV